MSINDFVLTCAAVLLVLVLVEGLLSLVASLFIAFVFRNRPRKGEIWTSMDRKRNRDRRP